LAGRTVSTAIRCWLRKVRRVGWGGVDHVGDGLFLVEQATAGAGQALHTEGGWGGVEKEGVGVGRVSGC
jgi:hypothetical protein